MNRKLPIPPNTYAPPPICDPVRRLYAAIVMQVIRDAFDPPASLSPYERVGAEIFLFDYGVEDYLHDAGVSLPWRTIRQTYNQIKESSC